MSTTNREIGDAIGRGLDTVLIMSVAMLIAALIYSPLQDSGLALFGIPAAAGAIIAALQYFDTQ